MPGRDEKHHCWKGDKATRRVLHAWVQRRKPKPEVCEACHKHSNKIELSNISGKYLRDVNDYRYLCRSCHTKYDCEMGFRKLTPDFLHNAARKGKKHTEESIQKMREAQARWRRQKPESK